jgi:hypothetical protein
MHKLGVQINESKSMKGFAGEFAKRLFFRGHEVTPIPTRMLQSTVVNPLIAKETFYILNERSCKGTCLETADYLKIFAPFLNIEKILEMTVVCTYPNGQDVLCSKAQIESLDSDAVVNPWSHFNFEDIETTQAIIKYEAFITQYNKLMSQIDNQVRTYLDKDYPYVENTVKEIFPPFQALMRFKTQTKKLHQSLGKL